MSSSLVIEKTKCRAHSLSLANFPVVVAVFFKSHANWGDECLETLSPPPAREANGQLSQLSQRVASDPGTRYRKSQVGGVGSMYKLTDVIWLSAGFSAGKRNRRTSWGPLQFLVIWINRAKPPSSYGWKKKKTSAQGKDNLRAGKGMVQKRRPSTQPQSHDSVSCLLPGRPDAHGATGGGRLSWFMNDPLRGSPSSFIRKDAGDQYCRLTELLSLNTTLQASLKLLEYGEMIQLPWGLYLTTRVWEPEVLTGCGGMRTRQIPSTGAPVSHGPTSPV